jgi:hypothetical protein
MNLTTAVCYHCHSRATVLAGCSGFIAPDPRNKVTLVLTEVSKSASLAENRQGLWFTTGLAQSLFAVAKNEIDSMRSRLDCVLKWGNALLGQIS